MARARGAHQELTCRRLFERSARWARSEFRRRAARPSTGRESAYPPTAEAKRSTPAVCGFAAQTIAGKCIAGLSVCAAPQADIFTRPFSSSIVLASNFTNA